MTGPTQIQATVIALRHGDDWVSVALTGPSGVGKTGLALRLMAQGWQLVADDAALVWVSGGHLWARAPRATSGLIEARGLGLISTPHRDVCRLALAVTLGLDEPERMPDPVHEIWLGLPLRTIAVQARAAAAPSIVTLALAEAVRRPVSP
ncbi:MAG: serine kinase [Brevundimonas sp.]|uniref:HPr kinase/phosphorylase n=1 Tax=Brevundimonas sp. TaxID=1871086 RepID=UPI00274F9714|nr:serine kinase [Brevundimonas sp.]MDP3400017.1 serine kinase [Brevundimonas sp.]MDZ4110776.1 serine kinase [Brevundimonas sp.]